jgi:hypothetical protein
MARSGGVTDTGPLRSEWVVTEIPVSPAGVFSSGTARVRDLPGDHAYPHGVLCSPDPTHGAGSSSRTWNIPPAISTFAPMHHRATNARASVAPQLKALLAPYPSDEMVAWPVSPRVGNVKNNDPSPICGAKPPGLAQTPSIERLSPRRLDRAAILRRDARTGRPGYCEDDGGPLYEPATVPGEFDVRIIMRKPARSGTQYRLGDCREGPAWP